MGKAATTMNALEEFSDGDLFNELDRRKVWPEPDINDFDDEEIAKEFEARGLADDVLDADVERLAEMIAAGEGGLALDLLARIYPDLQPSTVRHLVACRAAASGRLF